MPETQRRREKDGEYIFCVIYWTKLLAKILPRIPSRPDAVRSKTRHSVVRRNSPPTSLLIGSLICKALSAIWFHQNLLLQLHRNPVWSGLVLSFCVDGD